MVDDLAGRARAVDARPARRDADPRAARREREPELERARALVAVGALHAEVRHERVVAERQRVGAVLAEVLELPGALVARGDVERHERRDEARPRAALCSTRGSAARARPGRSGSRSSSSMVGGDLARRRGALVGVRREHARGSARRGAGGHVEESSERRGAAS